VFFCFSCFDLVFVFQAGRSSYVSPEILSTVPDPGAMAAAAWFRGAAVAVAEFYNSQAS
jgi:dihydroxyacetone kinase